MFKRVCTVLFFITSLTVTAQVEVPESVSDQIIAEVMAGRGYYDAAGIEAKIRLWQMQQPQPMASGEMTESGNCNGSCEQTGGDASLPMPRNVKFKGKLVDGEYTQNLIIKWKRPQALPDGSPYELKNYKVILSKDGQTYEKFKVKAKFKNNGKPKKHQKLKLRGLEPGNYTVQVRAKYKDTSTTTAATKAVSNKSTGTTSPWSSSVSASSKKGSYTVADVQSVSATLYQCLLDDGLEKVFNQLQAVTNSTLLTDVVYLECVDKGLSNADVTTIGSYMTGLIYLDISHNPAITNIKPLTDNLNLLESLDMRYNNQIDFALADNSLMPLDSLETIFLIKMELTEIPELPDTVTYINVSQNKISNHYGHLPDTKVIDTLVVNNNRSYWHPTDSSLNGPLTLSDAFFDSLSDYNFKTIQARGTLMTDIDLLSDIYSLDNLDIRSDYLAYNQNIQNFSGFCSLTIRSNSMERLKAVRPIQQLFLQNNPLLKVSQSSHSPLYQPVVSDYSGSEALACNHRHRIQNNTAPILDDMSVVQPFVLPSGKTARALNCPLKLPFRNLTLDSTCKPNEVNNLQVFEDMASARRYITWEKYSTHDYVGWGATHFLVKAMQNGVVINQYTRPIGDITDTSFHVTDDGLAADTYQVQVCINSNCGYERTQSAPFAAGLAQPNSFEIFWETAGDIDKLGFKFNYPSGLYAGDTKPDDFKISSTFPQANGGFTVHTYDVRNENSHPAGGWTVDAKDRRLMVGTTFMVQACNDLMGCSKPVSKAAGEPVIDNSIPQPQWAGIYDGNDFLGTGVVAIEDLNDPKIILKWEFNGVSNLEDKVDYIEIRETKPLIREGQLLSTLPVMSAVGQKPPVTFYSHELIGSMELSRQGRGYYDYEIRACRKVENAADVCSEAALPTPANQQISGHDVALTRQNVINKGLKLPDYKGAEIRDGKYHLFWENEYFVNNGTDLQPDYFVVGNAVGSFRDWCDSEFLRLDDYPGSDPELVSATYHKVKVDFADLGYKTPSGGSVSNLWSTFKFCKDLTAAATQQLTLNLKACKNGVGCTDEVSFDVTAATTSTSPETAGATQTPDVGGPGSMNPGQWWHPQISGTGWHFYWANGLRQTQTSGSYAETYDLVGYWLAYKPVGKTWTPTWFEVRLKHVFDPASVDDDQFFQGDLYYHERNASTGDVTTVDTGNIMLQLNPNNNKRATMLLNIDYSKGLFTQMDVSENIEPYNECMGLSVYECTDDQLGGGMTLEIQHFSLLEFSSNYQQTNDADHYSGLWQHNISNPEEPLSTAEVSMLPWIHGGLEYLAFLYYDNQGEPIWVQAQSGTQPEYTVPSVGYFTDYLTLDIAEDPEQDTLYTIPNGFNPLAAKPLGFSVKSRAEVVGKAGRRFETDANDTAFRSAEFWMDVDKQILSDIGLRDIREKFGHQPGVSTGMAPLTKMANLHGIFYDIVDIEDITATVCDPDDVTWCEIFLSWYTDAEFPGIEPWVKAPGVNNYISLASYVADANNLAECDNDSSVTANPYVVTNYSCVFKTPGTYTFQLRKPKHGSLTEWVAIAQSDDLSILSCQGDCDPVIGSIPASQINEPNQLHAHPEGANNVGAIAIDAGVSGGAATINIPVKLPPGRQGMQPNVTINYSSKSGDGALGVGWSLSAETQISRCPQTIAQDGQMVNVSFDATDRLCLNGQRLINVSGSYWDNNSVYRTELDDFVRVTLKGSNGATSGNSVWFEAINKDGMTYRYGETGNSRVMPENSAGGTVTHTWKLSQMENQANHTVNYYYTEYGTGEYLLDHIRYTDADGGHLGGRRIEFVYADRCDDNNSCTNNEYYAFGYETSLTRKLATIRTCVGGTCSNSNKVREYKLAYDLSQASNHLLLQSVQECAFDENNVSICLLPVDFMWQSDQLAFQTITVDEISSEVNMVVPTTSDSIDASVVDTYPELSSSNISSDELAFRYPDLFNGFTLATTMNSTQAGTIPGFDSNRLISLRQIGDLNGDGYKELYASNKPGSVVQHFLITIDETGQVINQVSLDAQAVNTFDPRQFADFNNDGITDQMLTQAHANGREVVIRYYDPNDVTLATYTEYATGIHYDPSISSEYVLPQVVDLNRDGKKDFLLNRRVPNSGSSDGTLQYDYYMNVGTHQAPAFSSANPPTTIVSLPYTDSTTLTDGSSYGIESIRDVNGDGWDDLVVNFTTFLRSYPFRKLYLNAGDGTTFNEVNVQSVGFVAGSLPSETFNFFIDINGDDLEDYVFISETEAVDTDKNWKYQLNRGVDFGPVVDTGSKAGLIGRWNHDDNNGDSPLVATTYLVDDYDSDGRVDLILPTRSKPVVAFCPDITYTVGQGTVSDTVCADPSVIPSESPELYDEGFGSLDRSFYQATAYKFVQNNAGVFQLVPIPGSENMVTQPGTKAFDLFGDGLSDYLLNAVKVGQNVTDLFAQDSTVDTSWFTDNKLMFLRNRGSSTNSYRVTPDLLNYVQDSLGVEYEWDYQPISANPTRNGTGIPLYSLPDRLTGDSYVDDGQNDHFYFESSMYVVSQFKQSDGIGGHNSTFYGYEEAVYNNQGRGFQGFRKITTETDVPSDRANDLRSVSLFHQIFPLAGKLEKTYTQLASDSYLVGDQIPADALSDSSYTWDCYQSNDTIASGCYITDTQNPVTAAMSNSNGLYLPILSATLSNSNDLIGREPLSQNTVNYTYDKYHNIETQVSTVAEFDDGTEIINRTVTVNNDFSHDEPNWWLNQLTKTTTTSSIAYPGFAPPALPAGMNPITQNKTTTTLMGWDATLRKLSCEFIFAGSASWGINNCNTPIDSWTNEGTKSKYIYYLAGSLKGHLSRVDNYASDQTTVRSTSTFYDAEAYFVDTVTNALNQVTEVETDPREGLPTVNIDIRGLRTHIEYDVFGKETKRWYPKAETHGFDDTQTGDVLNHYLPRSSKAYNWLGGLNNGFKVTTTTDGAPVTTSTYDQLGRVIRTSSNGFNSSQIVSSEAYNARGQLAASTEPEFNQPSAYQTVYSYDALGRVVKKITDQSLSNNSVRKLNSHYKYDGFTTTIWLNQSNTQPSTCAVATPTDLLSNNLCVQRRIAPSGQLLSTTDAHGELTEYWSDAHGNNLLVVDAAGNAIGNNFNNLNHKTDVIDPNMGHWTYSYNGYGELLTQQDAKSQVITHSYDSLGRLIYRTARKVGQPDVDDSWNYDFAGAGLLSQSTRTQDGVIQLQRTYHYDQNYRSTGFTSSQVTDTSNSARTNYQLSYINDDYFGRVIGMGYPNNSLVLYSQYDINGYLTEQGAEADYGDNTKFFYQVGSMSPRLQVTQANYGNGLSNAYGYYAATGQQHFASLGSGSSGEQQITYQYDVFGNLSSQSKTGLSSNTESYSYDHLHRLKSSNRSNGGVITYSYDKLGNLTSKSDFGSSYIYGGTAGFCGSNQAGPNAVTEVSLVGGGTAEYSYDANGNLSCGNASTGSLHVTYDMFNQTLSTSRNGTSLNFLYDAEHQRFLQTGDKHIAYVGKAYEHINSQQQKLYLGDYAVYTIDGDSYSIEYLHKDRLGSVVSISNASGVINSNTGRGFDPFGKPREDNWTDSDGTDNATAASGDLNGFDITSRGFTGHEQLNSVSLTHMNGRVYDYNLGRFLSVDPYIQGTTSQAINPYSYIQNNPLSGVDPSGYFLLNPVTAQIARAVGAKILRSALKPNRMTEVKGSLIGAAEVISYTEAKRRIANGERIKPSIFVQPPKLSETFIFTPAPNLPKTTPPIGPVPDLRNDTAHDNSASHVPDNSIMYSEGEGNSELQGETTKSKGLIEAERLRDEKLAELDRGSNTKRNRVSTVIGVHNPETGEVAVGVKITCPQNRGTCAENNAEDNLTEGVTDPEQLEFTKAIRPRNKDRIDRCDNCTKRYGKEPEGN